VWDKTIILPRTTHTPTPIIQGGEITPTSHGAMSSLFKDWKYKWLAKEMNVRKQGEFPTQTIPNPGGH
jgi:hypothetical protein